MARIPEPCSWLPGFEPEPAAAFAPPLPPFPPVPVSYTHLTLPTSDLV